MPAGPFTLYRKNLDDIRMNDLLTAVVKVALVTSVYTPNSTNTGHSLWADVSANEIAAGNGYTAGGYALTTDTVGVITDGFAYDSENPLWNATPAAIPAFRYAVLYVVGTLWGMTNPLVGYLLGDTTAGGTDVPATSAGSPLEINVHASGWFKSVQA